MLMRNERNWGKEERVVSTVIFFFFFCLPATYSGNVMFPPRVSGQLVQSVKKDGRNLNLGS